MATDAATLMTSMAVTDVEAGNKPADDDTVMSDITDGITVGDVVDIDNVEEDDGDEPDLIDSVEPDSPEEDEVATADLATGGIKTSCRFAGEEEEEGEEDAEEAASATATATAMPISRRPLSQLKLKLLRQDTMTTSISRTTTTTVVFSRNSAVAAAGVASDDVVLDEQQLSPRIHSTGAATMDIPQAAESHLDIDPLISPLTLSRPISPLKQHYRLPTTATATATATASTATDILTDPATASLACDGDGDGANNTLDGIGGRIR